MNTGKLKNRVKAISDLKKIICQHIRYSSGKKRENASDYDFYRSIALSVREQMIDGMLSTSERYTKKDEKKLFYISMEFLMGRSLGNNIFNLGIYDIAKKAMEELGVDLEEIRDTEIDAALGNGGLGRLAACFLDSLATLGMPGYGYGLNYEFGLFKQEIDNGYQREKPDRWDSDDSPWLITRINEACIVPINGRIDHYQDMHGNYNPMWMDWNIIIGVPHDMPIVGFGGTTVNYLRLFSARSSAEFDMQIFNDGDYLEAVKQKIASETISKVLYPSDSMERGKKLRLVQEYFLVACTIRDIIRGYLRDHDTLDNFHKKVAIQLNDTHPALAVAELMRSFVDEYDIKWDKAWKMTQSTFGYTNHTLLPEALEKWPVSLFEKVLPRHLQIIYEINHHHLKEVALFFPDDPDAQRRMSIIEEGDEKQIRMAYLAINGSHSVNGVAALHTSLVKKSLFQDHYRMWPERFNNKTNGVTQRRWLLKSNPDLAGLITETIGDRWIKDLSKLLDLEAFAEDKNFQDKFLEIKKQNKIRLAKLILKSARTQVDCDSLFDIQIKRLHGYKRQLLNLMHIIHQYLNLVEGHKDPLVPRTYIFSGKAAPGYFMAKLIIKLINSIAWKINSDKRVKGMIKVAMIPDYRVSIAEKIIPAANLSEQISTAGMEASGTGNMKLSMNGALTIGTLDGANIEIMEEVGEENIYIFGHTAEEIKEMRNNSSYHPKQYYDTNPNIKRVINSIRSGLFCPDNPELFKPIYDSIMHMGDYYLHLADFQSYIDKQKQVSEEYSNSFLWTRKAILNIARIGKFSSDRTILEYSRDIWNIRRTE